MAKTIAVFYGSNSGHTRRIAEHIAQSLGNDIPVYDVAKEEPSRVADYDLLVLGTSTWGKGEMQHSWEDFIVGLRELDLKGKKIAVFGCGDTNMRGTFCGGVGQIYNELQQTSADFIGQFGVEGYEFDHKTTAMLPGTDKAVGLLLDDVRHPLLTPDRIKAWTDLVKSQAE